MSGLDEILNIISDQQKGTEEKLLSSASGKAEAILREAGEKADKAYAEHIEKARYKHEHAHSADRAAVDSACKRRILECKVGLIEKVCEGVLEKLRNMPDDEYFKMLGRLVTNRMRSGEGVLELSQKDLDRVPADFELSLNNEAKKIGGRIRLNTEAADIPDGFILTYGLISENCSFEAVMESEKDGIRDTAARELFGR